MKVLTEDDVEAVREFVRTTRGPEAAEGLDLRVGTAARALANAFCVHRLAERDRLIARVERLGGNELVAEMLEDDEKH